jgi:magnesium transporter
VPEALPLHDNPPPPPSPEDPSYGAPSKALTSSIVEALEASDDAKVRTLISGIHAADISDLIDFLNHENRKRFITAIQDQFDPEILIHLEDDVRPEIVQILGHAHTADALAKLLPGDAIQVIEDFEEDEQQAILSLIPEEQRQPLQEALAHPEDSAGRLVTKNVVSVPEFWNVGQVIDFLRKEKDLPDDFFQIFVVDPKYRPVGAVSVSKIIRNQRAMPIQSVMTTDLKLIFPDMDQEDVAYIFRQYGLSSAPVVNAEGRLVGTISMSDIVEVITEEAEEDIMRLGGVSEADVHADMLQTAKHRFPWLVVNLLTAVLASIVIANFEGAIEKVVALAVLMPIVASMGGNAGTQTVTVAVRALAMKEITAVNVLRIIRKETFVGALNGLALGIVTGTLCLLWYHDPVLSTVLAFATFLTLVFAGFSGVGIPLLLVRLGVDPAIASGVFLTTVTDVVGFAGFLGLATWILI